MFAEMSLFILGSPVLVTNTDKIRYAEVNTTHIIECEVQGSSATPVWYFNNIPITSAPPYNIKQTKLTILSVSSELCGWYTCTASNQFGKQEVDFLVVVAGELQSVVVAGESTSRHAFPKIESLAKGFTL